MGLNIRTAEFLIMCRELGADFSDVCTLGHQTVMLAPSEAVQLAQWLGLREPSRDPYADSFFRSLGAIKPLSLDASAYQGADIIHNLNEDLPAELRGRFSCLIDGGTLEHIFDFPTALKNCMQMVRVGGHLVICQMANNCMGHGFYQFSPEVFYSAFTPSNGYEMCTTVLNEGGIWYEAYSPKEIGERVEARTRRETFIFVLAKRVSETTPFLSPPHQSDYESNLGQQEGDLVATRAHGDGTMSQTMTSYARRTAKALLPWLSDWQYRYNRNRYGSRNRLSNEARFRRIGRRLLGNPASTRPAGIP